MIKTALILACLALTALPAHAEPTRWAEDPGGRMRVIVTPPEADGTIRAALQVEPEDGFITYWREPGESGIPPQITISGSDDVALETIAYPVPKRIDIAGNTDMAYDGPVTFPLTLSSKPGTLPSLEISAFIGLCKDICIPFQATFDIPADPAAWATGPIDAAILAAARSTLPEEPTADFRIDAARRTSHALDLGLTMPGGTESHPEITLANSEGYIVEAPKGHWKDDAYRLTIPLSSLPEGQDAAEGDWLLLAKSGGRTLETPLVFDQGQP
ncbi:protein-disulfide reductase DsbD domain-containing protein [Martelella endophytica]|uniref:protein-disulfide reductase DsbD domain-containing protein n=1 Tax=Martelella endophytica TaxID=1486262 RepID=UPI0005F150CD|nr:protein-disulfide reductase DsbD domain-containing protein [Martelella endophytica]